MFFKSDNIDARILSVIEMGWQRVNARAGHRPFHTLSYRLEGDAVFYAQDRKLLQVKQDEIVFVPAEFDFSKQAGKGKILAIHFVSESDLPQKILRFSPLNPEYFRGVFQQLHRVWTKKDPGYEYEAKILLFRIILEIEKEWAMDRRSAASQKLALAISYIKEHFSEGSVSVDDLAKLCGMSDTYFRRLFAAEYGITPQRYINHLRLITATELLLSGYYSVSEIADRCGFNNINYFSTFIKKETGLSPTAYQKKILSDPSR